MKVELENFKRVQFEFGQKTMFTEKAGYEFCIKDCA
jgi:hypothetical protein